MKKTKKTAKQIKLEEMVKEAHEAGVNIDFSMHPKIQMPMQLPDDPAPVTLLIEESRRMTQIGLNWQKADAPNYVAADMAMKNGWAYSLAAAWLRCKLKGELLPESEKKGKA